MSKLDEDAEFWEILKQLRQPATNALDTPQRITLCRRALAITSRGNPFLWADLHHDLAIYLFENPHGERAENIEQAIHHLQNASEVYYLNSPENWGMVQHNLGDAYRNRIRGGLTLSARRAT